MSTRPSLSRLGLAAALALAVALPAARPAWAEPRGFAIGTQPAWFVLGGLSTGFTVAGADERGAAVGGELSVARLRDQRFFGAYAESSYDFSVDSATVGGGLEAGWQVIALDVGALARRLDDPELGVSARLCASAGVLSLCGRYARFFDVAVDRNVFQLGLLLKLPLLSPYGGT
ncbi:MAG: hypothetical protein R3B48_09545 [Kofleriaceae bacterium]